MQRFIRGAFVTSLVVSLFYSPSLWADPISVSNFSFELPGTVKQTNWENVPGWNSDTVASDSGEESDWPGSTEGVWAGYIMAADPSVWQLTDHVILPSATYTLRVDMRNNWSSGSADLQLSLYYDNAGNRITAASNTETGLPTSWAEYSLTFVTEDTPASIGNKIGIELDNISADGSWIGVDNIRLDYVSSALAGDLNSDGTVDLLDLNLFLLEWSDTPGVLADLVDDDKVDLKDYNVIAGNWLKTIIPATGDLVVTIEPEAARTAGAQWRVDLGAWRDSGYTEEGLLEGDHTVDFKEIAGWATPGDQNVSISKNSTTNTTGNYTQLTGSLEVTIFPQEAIDDEAQWKVDDGPWRDSGYVENDLAVGTHLVEYKPITGWNEPLSQQVDIYDDQTSTTFGTYELPTGSLQVILEPQEARDAGAQWRVDAGTWRNSNFIETNLSVGSHNVEFKEISNWFKPTNQILQINEGQTTPYTCTYIPHTGSLRVTIEPQGARDAGAQWRIVDIGTWRDSGYTETSLPVALHTVEFKDIPEWAKPGNQIVQITKDAMETTSGTYTHLTESGSLHVTIDPQGARDDGAQWRVDGGAWHDSGFTQISLSVGSHTVDFSTIAGWVIPSSDTVQINDGLTTYYTGTYIPENPVNVVINEIHYDPDLKTDFAEFVELYNAGSGSVDISHWYFDQGIFYTFPPSTPLLMPGDYIVVAQDPATIQSKYGISASKIYGPYTGRLDNDGETIELSNISGEQVDRVDYQLGFPWPTVGDAVPDDDAHPGSGHSIQLVDPYLDNDLAGSWRSAYPTPAAYNLDVAATNIPPHIRQVNHTPQKPVSGEPVLITAKVTDPDGVASVTLSYQLVDPGSYIPLGFPDYSTNPAYDNPVNWSSVPMHDDGLNGDTYAGDDIYTMQMSAGLQTNRRLVRYRITIEDTGARSVTVPYPDDPQPNFTYFVYDGVPSWTGEGVTYSSDVLTSLPVYHLISRNSDVENCQWNSSYDNADYRFYGTLVYDGDVYDHIRYRVRGQYSTFHWGKNKWKYNFNRGHYFQARDDYGKNFEKWNKMNIGTGACPWFQYPHPSGSWDVGTGGMLLNECMTFRLYNMVGVPACKTHYFHFRVIDDSQETGANQYEGDFWGLYFGFEHADGAFIDEHDIPDGNIYKMDGSAGKTNQGPTQVTDNSDVNWFVSNQTTYQTQSWWETYVNLDWYYSFKSVGIAVNNSDPRPQNNCLYYHNPDTDQWSIHPWDLDLTYEWATHYSDWEHIRYSLNHSALRIAYENRARELLDLLFDNNHYGWKQTDQLVDEMAVIIGAWYSGKRFIDAEQAMWEDHPHMSSTYNNLWYENNEYFDLPGNSKNWDNMVAYYKKYLTPTGMSDFLSGSYGVFALVSDAQDSDIPNKPTITYTGSAGYPENDLTFETSSFSDPQGSGTFAAMKWRLGRVNDPSDPGYNLRERHRYEIDTRWENAEITDPGQTAITIPATEVEIGGTYRVRCRMKDNTGRWSHWSDPIQFVAGEPILANILTDLRITELMYNPAPADTDAGELNVDNDEFEFIELKNTGTTTLDLSYVEFTNAIEFNFGSLVAGTPLIDAGFDSDAEGFTYSDDTFGTSNPDKATGTYESPGGYAGGGLRVYLGPGNTGGPTSGGWSKEFTLDADGSVTISVRYRMIMGSGCDSNEYGESVLAVDGDWYGDDTNNALIHRAGDGNTGGDDDYGWQIYETTIGLTAGTHTITVGAYINIATNTVTEWTEVFFDDIVVTPLEVTPVTLDPGQFTLVVKNQAAFESRYGAGYPIAGQYISGKLANEGEFLKLVDIWEGTIVQFEYNDNRGWPLPADGSGHSLVPLDSALPEARNRSLDYGGNWRASTYMDGSPAADDSVLATTVVLNEIMANTAANDWIELYNASGSLVNLGSDWYLSDDRDNLKKWVLPSVGVSSGGFASFDQVSDFLVPIDETNPDFEGILLSYLPGNTNDRVVDAIRMKAQESSTSLGRYTNGQTYWYHMSPSRDTNNTTPVSDLVIQEIMYHPLEGTDNEEYLELYNPTGSSISLDDWRLNGDGWNYEFPAGLSIPAGQTMIVVDFDPYLETQRLDDFETVYGTGDLTPGVDVIGENWGGNLSNGGERVALERPQTLGWYIVDEVIYFDQSPWPTAPDGAGSALERIATGAHGNDPANWQADSPSPGQ